jgi:hypothetical protein
MREGRRPQWVRDGWHCPCSSRRSSFCCPSLRLAAIAAESHTTVSSAEFISSWSTCWHWVRDVGVGFEMLALGSRCWRWVRGIGVGFAALALDENRQPSSYPHGRRVGIGFDMLTLGSSSDMLALGGVGFEMLALGSRRWHWTRLASRVRIPMVDVLALGSTC